MVENREHRGFMLSIDKKNIAVFASTLILLLLFSQLYAITPQEPSKKQWLESQSALSFLNPGFASNWEQGTPIMPGLFSNPKSNQKEHLTVINKYSKPEVWGVWRARFYTTGTADLIITPQSAVEGADTTFSEMEVDLNKTSDDLKFNFLMCGTKVVKPLFILESGRIVSRDFLKGKSLRIRGLYFKNYHCDENSMLSNTVLATGKHMLEFRFGSSIDYAFNYADCTGTAASPCHYCDFTGMSVTVESPSGSTTSVAMGGCTTSGTCGITPEVTTACTGNLGYTFCPEEGYYSAEMTGTAGGNPSAVEGAGWWYNLYEVSFDGSSNWCGCGGYTWFSSVSGGVNTPCCGDDGVDDDFYYYTAAPTTATSLNCTRCLDGSKYGPATLYGNGYLSGSGTSRTCYYGDMTCNASTAANGSSAIVYGWGWYSGNLTTDTSVSCRSGPGSCSDGSYASDSISTLYGNGYWSGSSPATDTSGTCYYGDITCSDGSEANGASGTYVGNGYTPDSPTTSTTGTCYYGNIGCSDGTASNGSSTALYGNGYTPDSPTTSTTGTCYYGDWSCGDGTYSNGSSTSLKGNGYYSGSLTLDTTLTCYYGDWSCGDGTYSNGATATLHGNGYLSGSGTSRTCYYGDMSCSDGSSANGSSAIVYGWGWYSGNLTTDTSVSCRSGPGSCSDGSYASDSISTLYGNGYWSGSSPATDTSGTCYYGDITCSDGSEANGASGTYYGNGYWSGSTCYYGDITCSDGSASNGASCTLNTGGECIADIGCLNAPTALQVGNKTDNNITISWTDNSSVEDGFKIERSPDGSSWTEIATVGANVTSYTDTGLSCNTLYYYRVRAYRGSVNSGYSSQASAYTLTTVPASVAVTADSNSQLTVTWSECANNSPENWVDETTGNSGGSDSSSWQTSNSYTDSGLSADTQYCYGVKARNGDGVETGYSSQACKYTLPDDPVPVSSSHTVNECSNDTTVDFTCSGAASGYYYVWNQASNTTVSSSDTAWDGSALTKTASSAGSWYLHVIAVNPEGAYNSSGTVHLGPFNIDIQAPTTSDDANTQWQGSDQTVTLSPSDGSGCGVANTYYCIDTSNTCSPSTSGTTVNVSCASGTVCQQYVRYYSIDVAGNTETVNSVLIRIDKEPPTTSTDANTEWVNADQTVNFLINDSSGAGGDSAFYCIDESNSCTPSTLGSSATVTCAANSVCQKYLRYKGVDYVGNEDQIRSVLIKIDKQAPTTSSDANTEWVNSDQAITLTPSDGSGSGIADTYYCVDESNTCSPSTSGTTVNVSCAAGTVCQQYVRYYSIDVAGNTESIQSQLIKIDKQLPSTSDDSNSAWQKTNVVVTLSPGDGSGSGVANTYYCVDESGTCTPSSSGTTVSVSCATGSVCQKYVRYYSTDIAGNQESIKTSNLIKIDKQLPVTTDDAPSSWQNSDVNITLTPGDGSGSGVANTYYCYDDSNSCTPNISGTSITIQCPSDSVCQKYLHYYSVDVAGNNEGVNVALVRIDREKPTTTDNAPSDWVNHDVNVMLSPSDGSGSGVASTYYCVDDSNSCSPATSGTVATVTCDANSVCQKYVRYYSIDNVSNQESVNWALVKIDKNGPYTSHNITQEWYGDDVNVELTCSSATNSCVETTYRVNGGSWTVYSSPFTVSATGVNTVDYNSRDSIGNVESIRTVFVRIDRTAPTTGNDANTFWQNTDLNFNLLPSDSQSGVAATYYCIDTVNACTPTTSGTAVSVTCDANQNCSKYVRYYSVDAVNNAESPKSVLVRIDKRYPFTLAEAPSGCVNIDFNVALTCVDEGGSGRYIIKYRFDSEQWLSSPQLTQLEALSWWDLNWARRRKILFDNSGQSARINSSVLLRLNSGNFHFLEVQENGQDIRFIDSDGSTQLQYFIDTFSRSQQDAVIWVKVPKIDADSNTDYIWMYYSNSNADANQVANWFG